MFGIVIILLFSDIVRLQEEHGSWGPAFILSDICMLLSIMCVFYASENLLMVRDMGLRPIRVYEDGLSIPLIYIRAMFRNGGFISKDKIDHISVRRW